METESSKNRIVEVKQIALYCPHCSAKLELTDYYPHRIETDARMICVFCGGNVMTYDLDQPRYQRDLVEKCRREHEISRISKFSGKSIAFVENYARENNLSAADLKALAEKIIHNDWNFEDETN